MRNLNQNRRHAPSSGWQASDVRPTPTQPLVISKFIKASALVALVLIASFGAFAYYTAQQARYYQSELGPGLSREFGFTHESPYVLDGNEATEVFTGGAIFIL